MAFEQPAPDLSKIVAAWEDWENGDQTPGKVLAEMKTAGLPEIPRQLAESGWTPNS